MWGREGILQTPVTAALILIMKYSNHILLSVHSKFLQVYISYF